jgi:ribose 5-phosphate isomerase A
MSQQQAQWKTQAAFTAASLVHSGQRLGLGSGSTVFLVVAALAERIRHGELNDLYLIGASSRTDREIQAAGLSLGNLVDEPHLDLAIDGADEIDPRFMMIKGGGGALLRERVVLAAARERVIVVDESKVVPILGTGWSVPVEAVPFGWKVAEQALRALGAQPALRLRDAAPVLTDEGNYVLDCAFGQISDPAALAARIAGQPGVVAHGIFVGLCDRLVVAGSSGVEIRTPG